jgi:hypothetical protein
MSVASGVSSRAFSGRAMVFHRLIFFKIGMEKQQDSACGFSGP